MRGQNKNFVENYLFFLWQYYLRHILSNDKHKNFIEFIKNKKGMFENIKEEKPNFFIFGFDHTDIEVSYKKRKMYSDLKGVHEDKMDEEKIKRYIMIYKDIICSNGANSEEMMEHELMYRELNIRDDNYYNYYSKDIKCSYIEKIFPFYYDDNDKYDNYLTMDIDYRYDIRYIIFCLELLHKNNYIIDHMFFDKNKLLILNEFIKTYKKIELRRDSMIYRVCGIYMFDYMILNNLKCSDEKIIIDNFIEKYRLFDVEYRKLDDVFKRTLCCVLNKDLCAMSA